MRAEDYKRWTKPLRNHPEFSKCLLATNKALAYLGYAIYPLLIIELIVCSDPLLPRAIIVPAVGFALVSVLRRVVNKTRPYETLDIDPLIKKDTHGKSFPSRHAFSMTMIAMTWLAWCQPVGICLLVISLIMGVVRILGGVHYPIDVAAGIMIAILLGIIGFFTF